jgi:hypothetical protein
MANRNASGSSLFLLTGVFLLLVVGAHEASAIPITLRGGRFTQKFGGGQGPTFEITNATGQSIFDFIIEIITTRLCGPEPGQPCTITEVITAGAGDPRFDLDDDFSGDLGPGENNDADSTPGTSTRIQGAGSSIPNNNANPFDMSINLAGPVMGEFTISLQPTDEKGRPIPEPSVLFVTASSLAAIGWVARKQRRR